MSIDLSQPDGQGNACITSMTVTDDGTTLNFEGPVEGYGQVFGTQTWTPTNEDETQGTMVGKVRVLLDDGDLIRADVRGTYRRDGALVKLFFVDAVSNGDHNFVAWDIDLSSRNVGIKYYSLK